MSEEELDELQENVIKTFDDVKLRQLLRDRVEVEKQIKLIDPDALLLFEIRMLSDD